MPRWIKLVLVGVLGLVAFSVLAIWMVLRVPFFSDLRRTVVAEVLSEQIGQQLIIKDDVSITLAPISRLRVHGVEIPSENLPDVMLAELKALELDVDLIGLLRGTIAMDNLTLNQLQVNLIRAEDGKTSWTDNDELPGSKANETEKTGDTSEDSGILTFLNDKTASFSEIGLLIDNKTTGFVFDFDLAKLDLQQLEAGQLVSLTGDGTVNGEPFEINGHYPRGKAFSTEASFGQLRLNFDGEPLQDADGGGFLADVTLDTGEFGEVLDILRLNRVLEGRGHLSAKVLRQAGITKISDFETNVELAEGEALTAVGSVESLLELEGFDLSIDARLYPENQPPEPAQKIKDLQLTGITAHIVNEGKFLKFANLEFGTNAFDQEFSQLGPVSIGRIVRSAEGNLSMRDIKVQIGPADDPYVKAQGDLTNLLQLKGIDFKGDLAAPATLILPPSKYQNADSFGRVQAEFAVDDAAGHITLSELKAYTSGTDLWSLATDIKVADVTKLEGMSFDLDLKVPVANTFLEALELSPVDLGTFEFNFGVTGKGKEFSLETGLTAGDSRLDASFDSSIIDGAPLIRGLIGSEVIHLADLRKAAATTTQLKSLGSDDGKSAKAGSEIKEEPLVLGKEPEKTLEPKIEEPLVQSREEEPLVTGQGAKSAKKAEKPADLLDLVGLMQKLDMEIALNIKRIEGQKGVSSVTSDLIVKDAQADFGPLEFSYGGGSFNVSAGMNLNDTPELVTVSGTTSGWDLGEILNTAGVNMDAHGKLKASFNLTGNYKSAKRFVNSMGGSVTASMYGGTIATSLIELAGLGVFPWLFSSELNKGYTKIVCAVAPVQIQSGRVSSNSIVLETERVQMVVAGSLDWKKETISMRAEPRPVGRPLARSAWPIDINGPLKNPDIKLQVGGSRPKQKEGPLGLGILKDKNTPQMPQKRTPCKPDLRQLE